MTVEQLAEALKPVIEEVVRKCMQEELREILTEAVEIASRPSGTINEGSDFEIEDTPRPVQKGTMPPPEWVQELEAKHSEAEAVQKKTVQESKKPKKSKATEEEEYNRQKNAIMGLLGQTAKSMTAEDLSNFK